MISSPSATRLYTVASFGGDRQMWLPWMFNTWRRGFICTNIQHMGAICCCKRWKRRVSIFQFQHRMGTDNKTTGKILISFNIVNTPPKHMFFKSLCELRCDRKILPIQTFLSSNSQSQTEASILNQQHGETDSCKLRQAQSFELRWAMILL